MSNLLEQYNFDKYLAIAEEVKKILSDVLEKEKDRYALFGITARAKRPESLEQKITKNNIDTLGAIKDLAGCRVIFYFNADVQKFNSSNIIRDNFELLSAPKYHNRPKDTVDNANELYTAIHYLIKLKEPNKLLSKYVDEDLICEIQIQTLLNHAYSETIHNITYKTANDLILGKQALEDIDNDFTKLMQKYLLPAGHYLSMIMQKHQQILKANDLAINIICNIQNTYCASTISNILDQWKKEVAKYYNDRKSIYDHAVKIVNLAIKKWENCNQDNDAEILLVKIIEILVYVMPLNVNFFFPKIANLYKDGIKENILDKTNEYLVYITRYSKGQIQYNNYEKQTVVLNCMSEWNNETLITMVDLVCMFCKEILQLEINHDDWVKDINYEEPGQSTSGVSIEPISFNLLPDKVTELRSRTITFLIKVYSTKGITSQQKEKLILLLSDAAKLPMNTSYESSLSKAVISNLLVIVEFYTMILPQEPLLCKLMYNQVFEYRRLAVSLVQQKEIKNEAQELLNLIDIFKNELTRIKDFEIYNILLSGGIYDYINDVQWREPLNYLSEFEKIEKDIETKILEYTNLLNLETEKYWEKIIIECVVNKGGYLLKVFLYRLGIDRPLFALNLLSKYETELRDYLIITFNGLLGSAEIQKTKNLLETWIIQGKTLELVVKIDRLDVSLLNLIYEKAKNESNFKLLSAILKGPYQDKINQQFVLPIIEIFTKAKKILDLDTIIHVINIINEQDLEKILGNLLHCKTLNQNYFDLIKEIASRKAEIIIPFFQKIFDSSSSTIVYDFYEAWSVGEIILKSPDNINHYADLSPKLFSFLFAIKNDKVQDLLYSLINSGKKVTFVIELLECYEKRGLDANNNIKGILSIMKQLIINNKLSDNQITKLESIITWVSNVVTGNYGYSEAFKLRQQIIGQWQNCNNVEIKNFAESVYKKLDQRVKYKRFYEESRAIIET